MGPWRRAAARAAAAATPHRPRHRSHALGLAQRCCKPPAQCCRRLSGELRRGSWRGSSLTPLLARKSVAVTFSKPQHLPAGFKGGACDGAVVAVHHGLWCKLQARLKLVVPRCASKSGASSTPSCLVTPLKHNSSCALKHMGSVASRGTPQTKCHAIAMHCLGPPAVNHLVKHACIFGLQPASA